MRPDPHSRNLRLHRLSDTPATFFITKSLLVKKAVLEEPAREIIVSALAFAVQQQRIYLRAFVVMPDHWHALFALRERWTLPEFMHDMMSYVGGKTSALLTKHKTWKNQ
jgi:REP element-mobilizing transposase RayT